MISERQSMINMAGSMEAYRKQGTGAENLYFIHIQEIEREPGPNNVLPPMESHLLILPKQLTSWKPNV